MYLLIGFSFKCSDGRTRYCIASLEDCAGIFFSQSNSVGPNFLFLSRSRPSIRVLLVSASTPNECRAIWLSPRSTSKAMFPIRCTGFWPTPYTVPARIIISRSSPRYRTVPKSITEGPAPESSIISIVLRWLVSQGV